MASGIKGITVEIGGNTAPLDKALKDINKTANNLQGELRSVDRALKFDPNNVTLVSQKQKILKEEIAATKEKLDTLKESQKQVKEQYKSGTIDDGQYRAFQRELETTKNKLSQLKEEKDSISVVGAAFGSVKEKISEATSKIAPFINGLKTAGKVSADITGAGIKTVGTAVDAAEKGLKIYAGTAMAAGTALAGMTYKAAAGADDINTLATQTGLSVEQIQKFQYATDLIDVPLETLTGSMSKLTRNMDSAKKGTGAQAEAFKTLGVSITDNNGQLRNNQEVFNESIIALGKMENGTQRDALAMQLFGKSAQDLNPLILGGADALKELGDSADNAGLILSKDALGNLNEFNDSVDILKANTSKAGSVLAGTFAGGLKETTDVIGSMIPKITGSLAQLFSGQNMEKAQQKLTSDLIEGANKIISNFAKQLPTFLNGFNAVILSILSSITETLPEVINTILPVLITSFVSLVQGMITQVPVLLPIIIDGAIQLFMGLLNGLNIVIPQLMDMMPSIIDNVSKVIIDNLPLIITAGIQLLTSLITGITDSIPQLVDAAIALIPVITKAIVSNLPALINAGIKLIVALATGLPQAIPEIVKALPEIISAIINGLLSVNWLDVGCQVIAGIAKGLWEGIKSISFKDIGNSLLNGFKSALGIHSPSVLFKEIVGKNLALGIEEGFVGQMDEVSKEMHKSIPTVFTADIYTNTKAKEIDPYENEKGHNNQNNLRAKDINVVNNFYTKVDSPYEIYKAAKKSIKDATFA